MEEIKTPLRKKKKKMFDYDEETLKRILSKMDEHNFKEIVYSWFSQGWQIGKKENITHTYPYR